MEREPIKKWRKESIGEVSPTEAPAPTQPAPTTVAGGGAGPEHPYVVVNRVLTGWNYALDGMAELESRLVRAFVERDAWMNWPEPRTPSVDAPCDEADAANPSNDHPFRRRR